jgi:hypothetical protein
MIFPEMSILNWETKCFILLLRWISKQSECIMLHVVIACFYSKSTDYGLHLLYHTSFATSSFKWASALKGIYPASSWQWLLLDVHLTQLWNCSEAKAAIYWLQRGCAALQILSFKLVVLCWVIDNCFVRFISIILYCVLCFFSVISFL